MRDKIDAIDSEIARLLDERMLVARQIGEAKKREGRAIFDEVREREILARCKYPRIWREIMEASRGVQLKNCLDRHIVLVGMMGSGKTTIGRVLSELTGIDWVDLDAEIGDVPDIFAKQGEAAFRELERDTLVRVCGGGVKIISTGGGVVLNEENRKLLSGSYVFFLNRPIDVIRSSVCGDGRPLFADLERIYEERLPLYRQVAHYEINGSPEPETAAKRILRMLESDVPRL